MTVRLIPSGENSNTVKEGQLIPMEAFLPIEDVPSNKQKSQKPTEVTKNGVRSSGISVGGNSSKVSPCSSCDGEPNCTNKCPECCCYVNKGTTTDAEANVLSGKHTWYALRYILLYIHSK